MNIEEIKQIDLVDFLTTNYGRQFHQSGNSYVCRSPFTEDRNPSFHVRQVDNHWLFKDFSSGLAGSIIDFVMQIHELNLPNALKKIEKLCGNSKIKYTDSNFINYPISKKYDIDSLFEKFASNNSSKCRRYLLNRYIAPELVDDLIKNKDVTLNRYKGFDYCCFAIRDNAGNLKCLENHGINVNQKFTLGTKIIYSRDWDIFPNVTEIFVCEGIIDYLSIKTMEGTDLPGLALLGNQIQPNLDFLTSCDRIISAFDNDRGGQIALSALKKQFPDKKIITYDLQGYNDPNDLLQSFNTTKNLDTTSPINRPSHKPVMSC